MHKFLHGIFPAVMPILNESSVNERIINGVPTEQVLPYQLQLRKDGSHYCGAVLISPNFALTAHHCFYTRDGILFPKEEFTVHAGGYTKLANNTEHRLIEKQLQFVDKKGQKKYANPDIVLLKLNEPFAINDKVKPACLPSRPTELGQKCIVSGWGVTVKDYTGTSANNDLPLQATELEVISNGLCEEHRRSLASTEPIEDHNLCLDSKDYDHKQGCFGDSGGPLVCGTDGGATIHGIVSGGLLKSCLNVENLSVFTDVFYFIDEIKQIIDQHQDSPCPTNDINYQDGYCDSRLNNAKHCFDGGDCCGMEADFQYCERLCKYHNQKECKCRCQSDVLENGYDGYD